METQTQNRAVPYWAVPSRVVPRSDKASGTHVTSAHKEMLHVNIANLTDVMLAGVLPGNEDFKAHKNPPKKLTVKIMWYNLNQGW